MPPVLLNAYIENLGRLEASEALQAAERIAVGSGTLKKGVGSRIASAWQRQADQKRIVMRPTSREAYRAQMAMVGIAVKPVKPDA